MVEDSKKVMKVRTTRKLYIPLYLMTIILIIVIGVIKLKEMQLSQSALIGVIVFIVIIVLFVEVHRFKDLYEINQNSLVHSHGILNKKIKSSDFFAISDFDVNQKLWQRLFGFGDVNVRLVSHDSSTAVKNINNPTKFAAFLEESISKKRTEGGHE